MQRPIIFVVALSGMLNAVTAGDELPSRFRITTKRDTDRVEVTVEKTATVFSIRSPVGIGEAVIARTDEKWPREVTLRLHLKGLESFRVANGKVTLGTSVSSQADDKFRVRLWKDGKEDAPLDADSPFWMEVRAVGREGKPANGIPLNDGYFEMQIPKAMLEGNPQSIRVNWIDFYRN